MATSMLKQRLIGAVVLIALGVIFIPMFLTGDGKFLSGDVDSNVPPKPMYELEAPKVLPLDKRSGQASEPVAEAAPKAAQNTAEAPDVKAAQSNESGNINKSGGESQPATTAKTATPSSEPVTEKSPVKEAAVETKQAIKQNAVPETKTAKVTSPEKTEPTPKPVEKPATETPVKKPIVTGWVVQLGSFSVEKNALKLRDSLRKNGHASFVEEYKKNGKSSYRVRVGPEQTRELANELKKQLKTETKLDGFVIEFPGK